MSIKTNVLVGLAVVGSVVAGGYALSADETVRDNGATTDNSQVTALPLSSNRGLTVTTSPQPARDGRIVQPGSQAATPVQSSTVVTTFNIK